MERIKVEPNTVDKIWVTKRCKGRGCNNTVLVRQHTDKKYCSFCVAKGKKNETRNR